jgi:hypothetical protein
MWVQTLSERPLSQTFHLIGGQRALTKWFGPANASFPSNRCGLLILTRNLDSCETYDDFLIAASCL